MRVQSAVICDSYEAVQDKGYTLTGVLSAIDVEVELTTPPGSPDPWLPFNKRIVLFLIDGSNGSHRLLLTVSYSERDTPIATHPLEFEWPENSPQHVFEIDLEMPLPGAGLYEFHVLIDGEPLASIPMRINTNIIHTG